MIDSWRSAWQKNFPFYFVQIAPYTYGKGYAGAIIREQQTIASSHANTGMVIISDLVDDTTNIHPKNKKDVGVRLANKALLETYYHDTIVANFPAFDSMQITDHSILIDFLNTGGELMAQGKVNAAVEIAGKDKIFYPAKASIVKQKLKVWSSMVPRPVAVRYAFSNAGIGNLYNKFGLPVVPFRTDDWPLY
jgi:sialate O-acetylesterase